MCLNALLDVYTLIVLKEKKMMKSDMHKDTRAKKGRSKKKRLLWFLLIPLLIIALGAGGYSFHIYSKSKINSK